MDSTDQLGFLLDQDSWYEFFTQRPGQYRR